MKSIGRCCKKLINNPLMTHSIINTNNIENVYY